jgi:hypothetical protein
MEMGTRPKIRKAYREPGGSKTGSVSNRKEPHSIRVVAAPMSVIRQLSAEGWLMDHFLTMAGHTAARH